MEFSRQEYWSGLPFPSPGDIPNPGIEPGSPALQAHALPSEPHWISFIYCKAQLNSRHSPHSSEVPCWGLGNVLDKDILE